MTPDGNTLSTTPDRTSTTPPYLAGKQRSGANPGGMAPKPLGHAFVRARAGQKKETAHMLVDVKGLDPAMEAPPLTVDVNPAADQPGHGRTLPLVGGTRPYLYDATYNDNTQRVYADSIAGVLSALIPGYAELAAAETAAIAAVEVAVENDGPTDEQRDAVQAALRASMDARWKYASTLRVAIQTEINEAARMSGAWDDLDSEEQAQCAAAEAGEVPVGVLWEIPIDLPGGVVERVDQGYWSTDAVQLVINRGDYGFFDPQFTPEPMSDLATVDETTGRRYVTVSKWPSNMVILDPTEEAEFFLSLCEAGVLSVVTRPVDLPDDFYSESLRLGRAAIAAEAGAEAGAGNGEDTTPGTADQS